VFERFAGGDNFAAVFLAAYASSFLAALGPAADRW
jgi:hypothetical protein